MPKNGRRRRPPYPRVVCTWVDSTGKGGWQYAEEIIGSAARNHDGDTETEGYLLQETPEYIVIGYPSFADHQEEGFQFDGYMQIFKLAIKSLTYKTKKKKTPKTPEPAPTAP